jgi:uncharacterized membrane-anchored protein
MAWVSHHRRLVIFVALVFVQAGLVVGIVVREERLQSGFEIVLQSRPVDPRDPLRGDFVILAYEAERLDHLGGAWRTGQGVFVEFARRGRYWEPIRIHRQGRSEDWPTERVLVRASVSDSEPLRVSYPNLGTYFVPQGTGNLPEPPDVIVSVASDGTARIKRLEIDGERWP